MSQLKEIKKMLKDLSDAGSIGKSGFIKHKDILQILQPRKEDAHKANFGHCLVIAGSTGKSGAAILCSEAALRSGCGLVTSMVNEDAVLPLLCRLPEAMVQHRGNGDWLKKTEFSKYNSVAFGPGVGTDADSAAILSRLTEFAAIPVVIDADGISLLALHKELMLKLNSRFVLTPHDAEFDRITQPHDLREERIKTQLQFSVNHQVTVVLKGRYTSVSTPAGDIFINTTGNNGMATAGSGDVLTGMIGSFLAQGYSPVNAAKIAVYFHGAAGDRAAERRTAYSMIAGDIIDQLRIK